MPTIGVAIPCYHGHITVLKRLLDSIELQTRKPDMVVVSCSSTPDISSIPYSQDNYSFPLQIIITEDKLNGAQNRNIGISNLQTDIISFIDADDIMHPQRLEIIEKAFKEHNIVMLLHSFKGGYTNQMELYDVNTITFDIGKIGINSWGYGALHLIDPKLVIHNGQSSVAKHVVSHIIYSTADWDSGKEDSLFTADIIRSYPHAIAYCSMPLSEYMPSGTNISDNIIY
jgi:glycosyltransferase involved in cell wall biosynthesis